MRLSWSIAIISLLVMSTELLYSIQCGFQPDQQDTQVAIVVGRNAPEIEHFAADQLAGYLEKLFGISAQRVSKIPPSARQLFLVGSPETNTAVKRATSSRRFPKLSDQGLVLMPAELSHRPAFVVGGGSPRATLWAVYELAHRWGVRYLLHGDVLPCHPDFHFPDFSETLEPKFRIRGWRVIDVFAGGMEGWGFRDYRPLIDQWAKMKFNRIYIDIWPWQPFLDYQVDGIHRRSASLWFNYHYPITPDMVGRELFGNEKEFWNPDIPLKAGYPRMVSAGESLVHELIAYAHRRGMKVALEANLLEFPPEFAPLLRDSEMVHQLGKLDVVPGPKTPLNDPGLTRLASAVLKATIDTYPHADYLVIEMPEFRQWTGEYRQAWQALDAKYQLRQVRTLDQVLASARARRNYPGGAKRAVNEVKGDIASLYFFDHLIRHTNVLKSTSNPSVKFIYSGISQELFPVLPRLLPHGWELMNFIAYTPSHILKRSDAMKEIPGTEIPSTLIYTLQDDNIGLVPQLTIGSLYKITQQLIRNGWSGFYTRYWLIGDQDPSAAYLSRAAWDANVAPDFVDHNQLRAVCGEQCANDMLKAFHNVEKATVNLEQNNLSFSFPVPGMILKNWKPGPMPADLAKDRRLYTEALESSERALRESDPRGRCDYVDYWVGRLKFAVGYFNAVDAIHRAATAEAAHDNLKALEETKSAAADARGALAAYALVARDQADRGAIAVMNEYVLRPLAQKVRELGGRTNVQ